MSRLAIVTLLLCCNSTMSTDADIRPFQVPTWSSAPSDDQIVQAIVGTGGSEARRAERERVTRALVLPILRANARGTNPDAVEAWLDYARAHFETLRSRKAQDAFVWFAVDEEIAVIRVQAVRLACAKLHAELFPTEPMPEDWDGATGVDVAHIERDARALEQRLAKLQREYGQRIPIAFADEPPVRAPEEPTARKLSVARNALHVAVTGDHSVTSHLLFDELVKRRIYTTPLPGEFPE